MAIKPPRLYVPLDIYYAEDEKVLSLSVHAELLWIRMLCEAKKMPELTGFVSKTRIKRNTSHKLRGVDAALRELEEGGLITPAERGGQPGQQIVSWSEWNMTETEADKRRRDRMVGGLARAHKAGQHRDSPSTECPQCTSASSSSAEQELSNRSAKRREEKTKSSLRSDFEGSARPDAGASGGEAPPTYRPVTPGIEVPLYPQDWHRDGTFQPSDYPYLPDTPHEGGWDGATWHTPSQWRRSWNHDGRRPIGRDAEAKGVTA